MNMKKITIYIVCFNEKKTSGEKTNYNNSVKDVISTTLCISEENYNNVDFIENYIIGFISNNGYDYKVCEWIIKKEKERIVDNTLNKSIFIENYML